MSDRLFKGALRGALLSALAFTVAACGVFGNRPPPPPCPDFFIVDGAGEVTKFGSATGRDITDIDLRGRISNFIGSCEHDGPEVRIELFVDFALERGPANRSGRADFEYFVAIPAFRGSPEGKRIFRIGAPFVQETARLRYRDELNITIPLERGQSGGSFDIYIGFQLTRDQLQYNRSRR